MTQKFTLTDWAVDKLIGGSLDCLVDWLLAVWDHSVASLKIPSSLNLRLKSGWVSHVMVHALWI